MQFIPKLFFIALLHSVFIIASMNYEEILNSFDSETTLVPTKEANYYSKKLLWLIEKGRLQTAGGDINNQYKNIFDYCISKGTDVNIQIIMDGYFKCVYGTYGSILMLCILYDLEEYLDSLLNNKKIEINFQNLSGFSALSISCKEERFGMFKKLLIHNADPNILDQKNRTILDIIDSSDNEFKDKVKKYLIEHKNKMMKELKKADFLPDALNNMIIEYIFIDLQDSKKRKALV